MVCSPRLLIGSLALVLAGASSAQAAPSAATATPNAGSSEQLIEQASGAAELASRKNTGSVPQHRGSSEAAASGNGRYVVFRSAVADLVPGSGRTRHKIHVYLRDLQTDTTSVVDVRPDGKIGNAHNDWEWGDTEPSVSADGSRVAFSSTAGNLLGPGRPAEQQVYLRDLQTGVTELASVGVHGAEPNSYSYSARVSADGSTVVFVSYAHNLVPHTPPIGPAQVYRRDMSTGETTRVSQTAGGGFPYDDDSGWPSVSADGSRIAFATGSDEIIPIGSYDGVALYDAATGRTTMVSQTPRGAHPNGSSGSPAISADGNTVVYTSWATDITSDQTGAESGPEVYAFDVRTGETTMVSRAPSGRGSNGYSFHPDVDATGERITFSSTATNLVKGDINDSEDVFLYDVASGGLSIVSRTPTGEPSNEDSVDPAIADDGSMLAYTSASTDLVEGTRRPITRVYAHHLP